VKKAAIKFDEKHPVISGTLRNIMITLGNMGI